MRKLKIIVGVLSLLLLLQFTLVAPVSGITQATRDEGNIFPSVGALKVVYEDGTEEYICSGVLISPTAFLTVGLCGWFVNDAGLESYISFDKQINRDNLKEGTWIKIKAFEVYWTTLNSGNGGGGFQWFSVGTWDEAIHNIPPATLTTSGWLDELSAQGGLKGVEFTSVGYGYQVDWEQGPPRWTLDGWRNYASAPFQNLTREFLDLNMNEHATGGGGACLRDNGAPVFLPVGEQNILVGLASGAKIRGVCRSTAGYWRLDTPWAQEFLRPYVGEER